MSLGDMLKMPTISSYLRSADSEIIEVGLRNLRQGVCLSACLFCNARDRSQDLMDGRQGKYSTIDCIPALGRLIEILILHYSPNSQLLQSKSNKILDAMAPAFGPGTWEVKRGGS